MIRRAIAVLALAAGMLVGGAPVEASHTYMGVAYGRSVYCSHTPTPIIKATGTLRSYCTNYAYRQAYVKVAGGGCDVYVVYGEAWKYTWGLSFIEHSRHYIGREYPCGSI